MATHSDNESRVDEVLCRGASEDTASSPSEEPATVGRRGLKRALKHRDATQELLVEGGAAGNEEHAASGDVPTVGKRVHVRKHGGADDAKGKPDVQLRRKFLDLVVRLERRGLLAGAILTMLGLPACGGARELERMASGASTVMRLEVAVELLQMRVDAPSALEPDPAVVAEFHEHVRQLEARGMSKDEVSALVGCIGVSGEADLARVAAGKSVVVSVENAVYVLRGVSGLRQQLSGR